MDLSMKRQCKNDDEWHAAVQNAVARLSTDTILQLDERLTYLYNMIGE